MQPFDNVSEILAIFLCEEFPGESKFEPTRREIRNRIGRCGVCIRPSKGISEVLNKGNSIV